MKLTSRFFAVNLPIKGTTPGSYYLLLFAILFAFITLVVPVMAQINEDQKFLAGNGSAEDEFGHSVSIDNGIVAVGAPFNDDNGINAGAAYLFDVNTGAQIAMLIPDDAAAGDMFGFSIAISNGIVAVGSPGNEHGGITSGAAYLFDASTGAQLAMLIPNDPEAGDEFGNSIAIDNGVVAVGAWRADDWGDGSGAAYLFDAATGNQLHKLLPDAGNNYQTFGVSIAMDDGMVAIGARTYFVLGEGFTFAKVYLFDVSTGDQLRRLQADIENYNGDQGGQFGDAVDIKNGLVAVGAPYRSIFFDFSGAAYVFNASTGQQLHFIYPADGEDRDHFGASIAIDNGVLTIGANEDDDSAWAGGSAYFFDANSGTQIDKLLASDGGEFDEFGSSIASQGGVTVVGAPGDDDNGDSSGSVYVFGAAPYVVVTLDPTSSTDLPAAGGTLAFDVNVVSSLPNLYPGVWFFTTVELPNGNLYPQNLFEIQFDMPPNANLSGSLNQNIPVFAPAGAYRLYGTVAGNRQGIGPSFSGSFGFTKAAAALGANPVNNWEAGGEIVVAGETDDVASVPNEFALKSAYPNPFNPATTLTVTLPDAANLNVRVFNVTGQEVAELANGQFDAGHHTLTFDASGLASGLYFVCATVPGQMDQVRKVMLVR